MVSDSPPKVRGPYRNGIKRRREIIESAAKVFGRFGYAGASLRQIAQDVGVSPAALMRHFDSKEGLLVAVLEYWDAANDTVLPESVHGLARFQQLPYNALYHTWDRGLIEMFLTVAAEASNPGHPANEFIRNRYEKVIRNGVRELRRACELGEVLPLSDKDIEAEVRGVFALMDGIQLQWLLDPAMDLVGTFKHCLGNVISRWTGGELVVWDDLSPAERQARLQ